MLNDNFVITGTPTITLTGSDGKVKEKFTIKNLVVQEGKNWLAARAIGAAASVMTHMAIGDNTTAANSSNTALGSELGRVQITSSSVATNTITYVASFGAGVATGAITEAGIFNASSSGSMLCRTTFNVVNKDASDILSISWAVTVN